MNKVALHNQSILDFVLHHTGSTQGVLEFCETNGLSPTEELIPGKIYSLDGLISDQDILGYYTTNGFIPATSTTIDTDFGIGEMIIESTFIVR